MPRAAPRPWQPNFCGFSAAIISDFRLEILFLPPDRNPGFPGIQSPAFAGGRKTDGAVAQLVEQWTENPCVGGSTPPHTTRKSSDSE
jgi:hypothetical protein